MPTWEVRTDRRQPRRPELLAELRALGSSIEGLSVEVLTEEEYLTGPDGGGFRDFATLARISHQEERALELVAEELIGLFGWLVDFAAQE